MIPYIAALVFFALFVAGVLRDRRLFRNAVFLGLALAMLAIGAVDDLAKAPVEVFEVVAAAILAGPALGILVLAVLLVGNGVTMVRREGGGLMNLLSLLAGLGILAFVGLLCAAVATGDRALEIAAASAVLVVGYVSFLFACFVGYAYLYGRMPVRVDVDYILVLGAGLVDGDQVPRCSRADSTGAERSTRRSPPAAPSRSCSSPAARGPTSSPPRPRRWPTTSWRAACPPTAWSSRRAPPPPRRTCASAGRSWPRPSPATAALW